MNLLITAFLIACNLALLFIARSRARQASYVSQYTRYVLALLAWISSLVLYDSVMIPGAGLLFIGRLNIALTLLFALAFADFALCFPFPSPVNSRLYRLLIGITLGMALLTASTPWVDVREQVLGGQHVTQFGLAFVVYLINVLFLLGGGIALLWRKLQRSEGPDRVRLYYFFSGVSLSVFFLLLTQLVLPLGFGVTAYLVPGTLALFFMTSSLYTVVVYDDFPGFSRTLVGIASNMLRFFAVFAFYAVVNSAEALFSSLSSTAAISYVVFCCFLLSMLLPAASRRTRDLLGRLFHDRSGWLARQQEALVTEINGVVALDARFVHALTGLQTLFQVSSCTVLLVEGEQVTTYGSPLSLPPEQLLRLQALRSPAHPTPIYRYAHDQAPALLTLLDAYGLTYLVPVHLSTVAVRGCVALGRKPHGDLFTIEEQEALSRLLALLALAIERAVLYQRNSDLVNSLEQRVQEATRDLQYQNSELQQAYRDLDEKARLERDMLDIMGHELRTPATVVKLASYMLARRVSDPEGQRQVARITESIERLIRLINTFINTAKLDNQKLDLVLQPVHLDDLVRRAVDDLQPDAAAKGLALTYEDHGPTSPVLADSARIREVIDNLISNAIKYTTAGHVKAWAFVGDGEVVVKVEDTGEGIRAEDQGQLFQKFKRLNNYTATSTDATAQMVRPGGTGLGLYVARGVIELHHGKIWVDSVYGQGSTFGFALPVASANQLQQQTGPGTGPARGSANLFHQLGLTPSTPQ